MNIQDIRNILDDIELKNFIDNGLRPTRYKQNFSILKRLKEKYNNFISDNEFVYLLRNRNNLENLHIFCKCGEKNTFYNCLRGYSRYCGPKCSATSDITKLARIKTVRLKYNKDNVSQVKSLNTYKSEKIKNKSILSNIKRKITKQIRYNDPGYHNIKKAMETNKKNHGGKHNWASNDPKLNGRTTKIEKYGDPFYHDKNKTRQTNLKRYGVEWCLQLPKVNIIRNCKEIRAKMDATKRKNNSYGDKSKSELRCYNKLHLKFPKCIHHYFEDKRYPFNCDMYIPELDLFIECHFGDFHYIEPFDSNNEIHLERLKFLKFKEQEKLKSGNKHTRYTGMIYTWTVSDPLKLKTFQDNHLNYKIFYTEKEFNEWFDSL